MHSDDSDEEVPSWAEQVASFPLRTANTYEVQYWLGGFLKQRAYNDEEIREFLGEVRLDGEDLHGLGKNELRDTLPKTPDPSKDGDFDLDVSAYRFESMHRTLFKDIMRARKEVSVVTPIKEYDENGIQCSKVDKVLEMPAMALCGAAFCVLGACCVFWALSWTMSQIPESTDERL